MSGPEFLVILFGLFVGYWLVSKFSGNAAEQKKVKPDPDLQQAGSRAESNEGDERPSSSPILLWHEVLQVPQHSSAEDIRRAYKTLMSQYHPDKVASLGPELKVICEQKTKEINVAYDQAMKEHAC